MKDPFEHPPEEALETMDGGHGDGKHTAPEQWEYDVLVLHALDLDAGRYPDPPEAKAAIVRQLNHAGQHGWEVCGITFVDPSWRGLQVLVKRRRVTAPA